MSNRVFPAEGGQPQTLISDLNVLQSQELKNKQRKAARQPLLQVMFEDYQ